ncbi:MAG: aminoglycoside phosphotransferase family protein [Candidatus Liptonbacteria bacterium]
MELDHKGVIDQILKKEFNQSAIDIKRMTTGLCNEVYSVSLPNRSVIIRLHLDGQEMKASEKFIPLFKSLGIQVPDIIASDYSKKSVPFVYQVLTKIDGRDIGEVIQDLTDRELKDIATEIAKIFRKLEKLPTNGRFGWYSPDKNKTSSSWIESLENMLKEIKERNSKTGVVGERLIESFEKLIDGNREYFSAVKSICYFDDICTKNVMVHDGKFSGLVDLDGVAYGDPLEAVGRIKASWFGTHYGDTYTSAVQDELRLNDTERRTVTIYAVLNHIYWLSENGVQFNQNTSTDINWGKVESDKKTIEALINALN